MILLDFERKERIIDDCCYYDFELEDHWWRTIDYLSLTGKSGIVLNPDKFQFSQHEVDFAGFRISKHKIEPLSKFYNAIRDFPTPKSTTDIRSWFGLVNQVSNHAELRDIMAPFRPFLSPRHSFSWNPELDAAFEKSKVAIIDSIKEGIGILDTQRHTCLCPDFSNRGIGYFLMQKHCSCDMLSPTFCPEGWRVTLAGSRFLTSAEQRYALIEGEALAVAWGLEETKIFTQGCNSLLIATDYKPLVKIFGDRTLDEISNTRLFRVKKRTLPWAFDIIHVPGKTNHAADAASRHPTPEGKVLGLTTLDLTEPIIAAAIQRDTQSTLSVSWEQLAKETVNNTDTKSLLTMVHNGILHEARQDPQISPYWQYRHGFYELDGVTLYNDRVVVPPSLRSRVLRILHSAHQGVSTMSNRARSVVF